MVSKTDIANRALRRIGLDRISNLTDDNPRANAANDAFDQIKEETLSKFPWPFAIVRVELSSLASGPDFGYTYYFTRPADMLYPVDEDTNIPFTEEGDKLLADSATLKIRYVSKDVLEAKFSPLYSKLFAINLAIDLTYEFENKLESRESLLKEKEDVEAEAFFAMSMSGEPDDYTSDTFIDVRR